MEEKDSKLQVGNKLIVRWFDETNKCWTVIYIKIGISMLFVQVFETPLRHYSEKAIYKGMKSKKGEFHFGRKFVSLLSEILEVWEY